MHKKKIAIICVMVLLLLTMVGGVAVIALNSLKKQKDNYNSVGKYISNMLVDKETTTKKEVATE